MNPVYSRIPVSDAGGMAVNLPVVDIGPEPRRLAVIAGIHGDEPSPILLVDRLVVALRDVTLKAGIRIVAAANPPALMQRARWSNWDDEDMNRVGDGGGGPALTRRLASTLCDVVEGCQLAINLHNFVMRTPLLAIQPPGQTPERKLRHKQYIEALDPHVVWVFGEQPEDIKIFQASIDAAMEQRGVDVMAVEMSDLPELDEPLLRRSVVGLLRLAELTGCIENAAIPAPKHNAVHVVRLIVRAPGAGIFEPVAPLGGRVETGDVVGHLIPLERPGERVNVLAPKPGWLIQRLGQRFVRPGDMIVTVGLDL